jgi:hypothetical protein
LTLAEDLAGVADGRDVMVGLADVNTDQDCAHGHRAFAGRCEHEDRPGEPLKVRNFR